MFNVNEYYSALTNADHMTVVVTVARNR